MVSVRSYAWSPNICGVTGHSFVSPSPIDAQAVLDLEAKVGILPYEYRRFILECGAAGQHSADPFLICGSPGYGIYRDPLHGCGPAKWDGALEISTMGCRYSTLLVLSGLAQGTVWLYDLERCCPVVSYPSFLDWMLSGWLEDVIALLTCETDEESDYDP